MCNEDDSFNYNKKTPETIEIKHLDTSKKRTAEKNIQLLNNLEKEADKLKRIEIHTQIKSNKRAIKAISRQIDSLHIIYLQSEILANNLKATWFPGTNRSRALFSILYSNGKSVNYVNNAGLSFGSSTASIYSELANGYAGGVRVGLGSMIVSSQSDGVDSSQEEALQKLQNNGGNVHLSLEYPVVFGSSKNNLLNFACRLYGLGTADMKEFGTQTDEFAASLSGGLSFYLDLALHNRSIVFFTEANMRGIYGSGNYMQNLQEGNNDKTFTYGTWKIGLTVLGNVQLSFNVIQWSSIPGLRKNRVTFGGQLLR